MFGDDLLVQGVLVSVSGISGNWRENVFQHGADTCLWVSFAVGVSVGYALTLSVRYVV